MIVTLEIKEIESIFVDHDCGIEIVSISLAEKIQEGAPIVIKSIFDLSHSNFFFVFLPSINNAYVF